MGDTRFHLNRPVPPNSPDLNPVDYGIWVKMQQQSYQTKVHDIVEMKQHILCLACGLEQNVNNDAINE